MALTVTQIQQLYTAYLGRAVDQEGVDYWTDAELDLTVADLRFNLANENQPEYVELYGNLSREDLVKAIYQNMFNRLADDDGLAYWTTGEGSVVPANELQQLFIEAASDEDKAAFEAEVQADLEEYEAGDTSELTEALQQYEAAVNAESEAEVAFSAAVVEAGLEADTDADDDGVADDFDPETNDYVLLAESDLLTAQQALNAARRINTDAKLAQNVVDAQKLVSDDTAKYSVDGVDVATIKKVYQITDAGTSVLNANGFYTEDATFGDAVTKLVGYVDPTDTTDDLVIDGTSSEVTVDDAEDAGGANVDNSTSTVTDLLITTTYSALQLQSRLSAAEASLAGNIASKGETADLADQLNDDIALYQANNPVNGDLTTLQTALQTYLAKVEAETVTDADVVTVLEAASVAQAAIFDAKGNSLLADGATGDSIESLVSILDTRDTLSDAVTAADTAFQATANGAALVIAENAVETREGLIQAVADKQADVEAVTEAADAYAAAQDAVTAAGEELGYTIEAIDSGIEFATDEADLFTFDAKDLENTPDVVINDLASDDLIYLGSDYALGVEGSADNNALEVFLTEVNGNAVLQVENTTFGSASDDFTEITLTGVAAADVTIENGVVSIVEVA